MLQRILRRAASERARLQQAASFAKAAAKPAGKSAGRSAIAKDTGRRDSNIDRILEASLLMELRRHRLCLRLPKVLEIGPCSCWLCCNTPPVLTVLSTWQLLAPDPDWKPEALSPEEEAEWNRRAKEYSRRKMAQHRAFQKVGCLPSQCYCANAVVLNSCAAGQDKTRQEDFTMPASLAG